MLQLHKAIIAICTGYVCTLVCHQLPIFGSALTLRTKSITDALTITRIGDTEEFSIPEENEKEPSPAEQAKALEPQEVPEIAFTAYSPVAVATPVATATASLVTNTPKAAEPATTTTTAAVSPTETTCSKETDATVSETESAADAVKTEPVETAPVSESEEDGSEAETETNAVPIDAQSLFLDMDTWFKAYMDYRTITDTSSVQYALQQEAWTDDQGLRRIGDDYLVAMGTGWLTDGCGERFLVTLETGAQFTVMVGDIKADCDTDPTRRYRICGGGANVIEFIVDTNLLSEEACSAGTISAYATFEGNIAEIAALE